MPATTTVTWNPGPLNSAVLRGFKTSVYEAGAFAKTTSPAPSKAGCVAKLATPTVGVLVPTGLGFVFQKGRAGGYPIFPGGAAGYRRSSRGSVTFNETGRTYSFRTKRGGSGDKALKFSRGDGGFAAYATGGPMKPEPYVSRAGVAWAQQLGPRAMGASLTSAGFSAARSIA